MEMERKDEKINPVHFSLITLNFKVLVLDFDGVLVESNTIKHQAIAELFKGDVHFDEIMAYHLNHNSVDRYQKFKHILTKKQKKAEDPVLEKKWALKFSELTRQKIIGAPLVKGSLSFLQSFSKVPLYLVSATPLKELEIILKEKTMDSFFKKVYGAPLIKQNVFLEIAQTEKIAVKELLYIGDSYEDYRSAQVCGCQFIHRKSEHDMKEYKGLTFDDMEQIKTYLMK